MKNNTLKLPQDFLAKIRKIYPSAHEDILQFFSAKKTAAFRINYLKTDYRGLKKRLFKEGVRFKEVGFPKGAFLLKGSLRRFLNTEIYREGLVCVQDFSSMLPVFILSPEKDEKILDLCPGQGEKAAQIASSVPQTEIITIEPNRRRHYKLLATLKTQGAEKVSVKLYDAIWVRKKFPEYFDKIIVTPPSSAEARFCLEEPRSFKYWKEKKIKEFVHRQKRLLTACFFALKEGGSLVYSTPTFSPEENEGVINWFINKYRGKVEVLPVELPLTNIQSGLSYWEGMNFSHSLRFTKRIVPSASYQGRFLAKIKKLFV